ncbi:FAD-dependent oxidoreductase [Nocardia sp. NPDC051570]|uniref:hydroxysqualene dehydroxylase n=1 Tax=Nocardia sp. NPDC051570 TaxID=3364324 RepID=UPI0037B857DA
MTGEPRSSSYTRRAFVRTAATAGIAVSLAHWGSPPAHATLAAHRVAVLGGGMAGLAAAHELAERGFEVVVYERKALGGKARSIVTDLPALDGRRPLPGEHGFRFFPGFYHNVPDTMRRIPFPGNGNGVWDNLVTAPTSLVAFDGGDILVPFGLTPELPGAVTPQALAESLVGVVKLAQRLPPAEIVTFARRLAIFLTSCEERRYGQWEHISWMEFIQAQGKSEAYRHYLAKVLTRALVAAKEQVASSRTIGNMADAFLATLLLQGNDGAPDRVLNLPTNEAWIDPWVDHLRNLGVRFEVGATVESLRVERGRVAGLGVSDAEGRRMIDVDWVVCAVPVERATRLWNRDVLALDPALEAMNDLSTDWMNGIQFYLTSDDPITEGHIGLVDSPWALSGLNQAQFWRSRDIARDYGDGTVRDILSVDISDWNTPGILYGRPAVQCSRDEIAAEVWAQLKAALNDGQPNRLRDQDLHSYHLDPAIQWSTVTGRNTNDEPLLVNTAGSWDKRPDARTAIPNLFLAGDYVRTDVDLATMEGANESGRAAVNALLDAADSNAPRAQVFKLYRLPQLEPAKQLDRLRYLAGQPHILDG